MIKVLHIMAGADAGGISSVVLNYYKFIDRKIFKFDLLITTDTDGINGKKMKDLGASVFKTKLKSVDRKKFEEDIELLIKKNGYDVVHVHENETSWVALRVAEKCGVKCRIAHAHTAGNKAKSLSNFVKRGIGFFLNSYYSTLMIACGKKAGDYIFGHINMLRNKSVVLPNAIDVGLYRYNKQIRREIREQLGLEQKFVIGFVGRISPEKNIVYAVDIFKRIKEKISNAVFVIVGDGIEMKALKEKILHERLDNDIICLGKKENVNQLMQAFDIFLLPSLYEGFPVVAVEAMASGLPVLMSDRITDELSFGSAVRYLPLDKLNDWADAAEEFIIDEDRDKRINEVLDNGLDIRHTVGILQDIYMKFIPQNRK